MRIVAALLFLVVPLYGQAESIEDLLRVTEVRIEKRTEASGIIHYSAEAELHCSSPTPITAYTLTYVTSYADGTVLKGTLWEDFVPTLPLVGMKVLGSRKVQIGPLRNGDTHHFPFSLTGTASKAVPTKVKVEITGVVFEDCTVAGRDEKNLDWIFADRQRSLRVYQGQLSAASEARRSVSEAKIIPHLRSKLSEAENGLTKNGLMRDLDNAERQAALGREVPRIWLAQYEKKLLSYISDFERHQTQKRRAGKPN
ncbi:MAG: hypothetical protein J0H49_30435 [Acidobacteria bacterium]|nr:hypothetical protein [Acidobacteriota bacterium]